MRLQINFGLNEEMSIFKAKMPTKVKNTWKKLGFGEGVRVLARDSRLGEAVGI